MGRGPVRIRTIAGTRIARFTRSNLVVEKQKSAYPSLSISASSLRALEMSQGALINSNESGGRRPPLIQMTMCKHTREAGRDIGSKE